MACTGLLLIGCGGPEVTGSKDQKEMIEAMRKSGGDSSKLDDAMRQKIDQANTSDPMSTASRPGGPGAAGPSGMPSGYPSRSGA
jgi:hypothetical protein